MYIIAFELILSDHANPTKERAMILFLGRCDGIGQKDLEAEARMKGVNFRNEMQCTSNASFITFNWQYCPDLRIPDYGQKESVSFL